MAYRGQTVYWLILVIIAAIISILLLRPFAVIKPEIPTTTPKSPQPTPTTTSISSPTPPPSKPTIVKCADVYINYWRNKTLYFPIYIKVIRAGVAQSNATIVMYNTLPSYYFNSTYMYEFRPDPLNNPYNFSSFILDNASKIIRANGSGFVLLNVTVPSWLTDNDTLIKTFVDIYSKGGLLQAIKNESYKFKFMTVLPLPGYYAFSEEMAYTLAIDDYVANYTANSTEECLEKVNYDPSKVFRLILFNIYGGTFILLPNVSSTIDLEGDLLTSGPSCVLYPKYSEQINPLNIIIPVNNTSGSTIITYNLSLRFNKSRPSCYWLQARIFKIALMNLYNSYLNNTGIYKIDVDIRTPSGRENEYNITAYNVSYNPFVERVIWSNNNGMLLNPFLPTNYTFYGYLAEPELNITLRIYVNNTLLLNHLNTWLFGIGFYQADPIYLIGSQVNNTFVATNMSIPIVRFAFNVTQ